MPELKLGISKTQSNAGQCTSQNRSLSEVIIGRLLYKKYKKIENISFSYFVLETLPICVGIFWEIARNIYTEVTVLFRTWNLYRIYVVTDELAEVAQSDDQSSVRTQRSERYGFRHGDDKLEDSYDLDSLLRSLDTFTTNELIITDIEVLQVYVIFIKNLKFIKI